MTCDDVQQALEAASDPGSPAPLSADVAAHLQNCAACSAYATRMKSDDVLLSQALAQEPRTEQWKQHQQHVTGSIQALDRRQGWNRRFWIGAAAAAMLALTLWSVASFVRPTSEKVAVENPKLPPPKMEGLPSAHLIERVAHLQETVRDKQVLDELEQLQITFENAGDAEGKSLAEDAELYVERILALDAKEPEQMREILSGIRSADISSRFEKLRESIRDDAPAPLQDSLKLAQTTLAEASDLADAPKAGASHAD
jgi:hypothetical protein